MTDYQKYLSTFIGGNFTVAEFSRLGSQHGNRHKPGYKKNHPPEMILWGNIIPTYKALELTREKLGYGITPTITFRSDKYNKAIGGVPGSAHTFNRAVDWWAHGGTSKDWGKAVLESLEELEIPYFGIGVYDNFIHTDTFHTCKKRLWGKKLK